MFDWCYFNYVILLHPRLVLWFQPNGELMPPAVNLDDSVYYLHNGSRWKSTTFCHMWMETRLFYNIESEIYCPFLTLINRKKSSCNVKVKTDFDKVYSLAHVVLVCWAKNYFGLRRQVSGDKWSFNQLTSMSLMCHILITLTP